MKWQKCPRCNSNRVGKRKKNMGCFSFLFIIIIGMIASSIMVKIVSIILSSVLPPGLISFSLGPIVFIFVVVWWIRSRVKNSVYLYCKDCELMFQPSEK